jgi:hypothetical protein
MQIFDSKCKQILSEGLIRSYNSEVYIKLLYKKLVENGIYGTSVDMDETSKFYHGDSDRMIFNTEVPISNFGWFKELNKVCGYTDIGVKKVLSSYYTTVEKVFPHDKPLDFANIAKFYNFNIERCALYHVTRADLASKIKRIGLTPRGTQTSFGHAGNRIYLYFSLAGDKLEHVEMLGRILARNRAEHTNKFDYPMYSIFKIKPTDDMKFYLDPSLNIGHGFTGFGVFTHQNISPENITEIHRFDTKEEDFLLGDGD